MQRPNSLWLFEGLFYLSVLWQIILAYPDTSQRLAAIVQGTMSVILVWLTAHVRSTFARWLLISLFLLTFFSNLPLWVTTYYQQRHMDPSAMPLILQTLAIIALLQTQSRAYLKRS